jgi:hypothetical protein
VVGHVRVQRNSSWSKTVGLHEHGKHRVVETSTTVAPCACKAGWNGPKPDFALRPFANTWRAMDGSIRFVKDQNPA